jgi:hypothetical protein
MIFLSYNHNDKELIDSIAKTLSEVFGQSNVFYDDWSIQPGEEIIDKMNEGLENCKFFFFFVSKNSLNSNMVKLEWQNALLKKTKNQIKLIPVKIDDCLMPGILLQTKYIDIFGQGLENGTRQIVDVINEKKTYQLEFQTYENIRGYIKKESRGYILEFRAESYLEPQSRYLILLDNKEDDFTMECLSDGMTMNGFNEDIILNNGLKANAVSISIARGTSPGFPFVVKLVPKPDREIKLKGLMRAVNQKEYKLIPVIEEDEN